MATTQQRNLLNSRQYNESRVSLTTNSTKSQRLTRKRDTSNSGSRNRSRSREQYEDKDFETYLKHLKRTKTPQNHVERSLQPLNTKESNIREDEEIDSGRMTNFKRIRPSIIEQNNLQISSRKKRQPTPVKSRREIEKNNCIDSKNQTQKFQLELKVAGLQNQLNIQKSMRMKFSDNKLTLQKTVQHLKQILSQLEIQNNILLNEKKNYQEKIHQLESTILQSQKDHNITKNKLNKLKQTIKQNKMSELQAEIRKLTKCNQHSKSSIKVLEGEKGTLLQELAKSNKEITQFKRQIQILEMKVGNQNKAWRQSTREQYLSHQVQKLKNFLQTSKEERQKFIQTKLMEKDQTIFYLKNQVKNLKIQVRYLQQSKDRQINELKNSKETQLKKLRVKCSKLVNELKQKQNGKSPLKPVKNPNDKYYPTRSSIMERSSQESISLSLSPDDHHHHK